MRLVGLFALGCGLICAPLRAHAADDAEPVEPAKTTLEESAPAEGAAPPTAAASDWCSADVETLPNNVCYAKGPNKDPKRRTLVIFLHGLTEDGAGWQHSLQKGMAIAGKRLDFSALMPRGRNGVGPGRKQSTIAWPGGEEVRKLYEDEVIKEWFDAKAEIEKKEGAPFDEVFVMGFSNGAYYASSLALRGRLDVDGYAVFAGGSSGSGAGKHTKNRQPLFVGVATKDATAKKGKELAKTLGSLKWPHRVDSRPVGHVVADGQLDRAVEYLRAPEKPAKKQVEKKKSASKTKPAKPTKKKKK
jgi:predicted esterase